MSLKKLVIKKKIEDEVVEIPEDRLVSVEGYTNVIANRMRAAVVVRCSGNFGNKAFCLNSDLDWEIGIDEFGVKCLVPLRKEGEEEDDI